MSASTAARLAFSSPGGPPLPAQPPLDLERLKIERAPARAPRRSRRLRGMGWILLLASGLALAWVFRAPLTDMLDRVRLPEVRVQRVARPSPLAAGAVSGTSASGYIVAGKRAALSADTPGRIVEMNVTEGAHVKKGDVVARLFAEEYAAALRQAEARVESARKGVERSEAERQVAAREIERLEADQRSAQASLLEAESGARLAALELVRAQELADAQIESRQRLDQARAADEQARALVQTAAAMLEGAGRGVEQARARELAATAALAEARSLVPVSEAARDQARATLEKTEVRAPFDGIVVLKDAEVGEVVSPNAQGGNSRGAVATMVDLASLEVQVEVPELNISAVVIGEPATIYLDAYPREPYSGRVERVWPTANRQKATIEVRVAIDAPDLRLRPEMGARVVFHDKQAPVASADAPAEEGVLAPSGAVLKLEGGAWMFVLERDIVRLQRVELGPERGGRVLVRSGVEDGERVVVDPPARLEDGARVRAVER